jgi:ketol-acid reductoisomerase
MSEGEGDRSGSRKRAARVAIIGYGPEARDQAVRLRTAGWEVDVVVRAGGMSWIRAVADGFRPVASADAAAHAEVVVVHLPESEQPAVWAYGLAPFLAPGTLVVFSHGTALYSGVIEPDAGLDVVLVIPADPREAIVGPPRGGARVAVVRNATGHALERALAFARAVFGNQKIGTTTLDSEVMADLVELGAKKGGLAALLAEWDRVLASPSHEPDEGTLTYYERLRAVVLAHAEDHPGDLGEQESRRKRGAA